MTDHGGAVATFDLLRVLVLGDSDGICYLSCLECEWSSTRKYRKATEADAAVADKKNEDVKSLLFGLF